MAPALLQPGFLASTHVGEGWFAKQTGEGVICNKAPSPAARQGIRQGSTHKSPSGQRQEVSARSSAQKANPCPNEALRDEVYVGIDVCKDWLDVHLHPIGRRVRVANSRDGLRRLLRILADRPVALAVMEATAKYTGWLIACLLRQALRRRSSIHSEPVCLPRRAASSPRRIGSTPGCLRSWARASSLRPWHRSRRCWKPCRSWCAAVWQRSRKQQRWRTVWAPRQAPFLKSELKRLLKGVRAHIERLEAEIERLVEADATLKRRYDVLMSIPGIGPVVAVTLLAELAELGSCSAKAASSIAGLAPLACDSGDKSGQRRIRGGRHRLRSVLYMAALAVSQAQPRSRRLLQTPSRRRQEVQGCAHCRHAKARRACQHPSHQNANCRHATRARARAGQQTQMLLRFLKLNSQRRPKAGSLSC